MGKDGPICGETEKQFFQGQDFTAAQAVLDGVGQAGTVNIEDRFHRLQPESISKQWPNFCSPQAHYFCWDRNGSRAGSDN